MKLRAIVLLFCAGSVVSGAQTDSTQQAKTWSAGLYVAPSLGFGVFSNNFRDVALAGASVPVSGSTLGVDIGVMFPNRFGIALSWQGFFAGSPTQKLEDLLEAREPGYELAHTSSGGVSEERSQRFLFAFSYVFSRKRAFLQPELLVGSTQAAMNSPFVVLKEPGTQRAIMYQYKPKNVGQYYNPTVGLGCRATWYATRQLGLFAGLRVFSGRNTFQFDIERTDLVEQTVDRESFNVKKNVVSATLNVGVFLQIGQWKNSLGDLLF